jgi:hypothetical protein
VLANIEIDVISAPPGAHVLVDGSDTGKVTPTTLMVPKKRGAKISITLRLKGYNTTTLKSVDTAENSQQRIELVKAKPAISTPPTSTGRTNGSGNKPGSAAGSDDPDGLMRP